MLSGRRQGKQEPCKLRTENERTAQAVSAPSPVGSNPEFEERRTKNAEQKSLSRVPRRGMLHVAQRKCSIQRRYASETSVKVLIVLRLSFLVRRLFKYSFKR